jgi:hypothetical protein
MAIGGNNTVTSANRPKPTGDLSGFRLSEDEAKYRLLLNLQGLEKTGKNHFSFTAPDPIALLSFDLGIEGVIEKFNKYKLGVVNGIRQKRIYLSEYELLAQPGVASEKDVEAEASKLWNRVVSDFRDAFASPSIRTVITDTGSELWELKRLSEFGKMSANVQHYGPVNADFRRLVRIPYDTDKNFIMIHKMKDEWIRGADGKAGKSGKLERSGMKDIGFLLQGNLQTWRDPSDNTFHATMLDCRHNPEVNGFDFTGEMCNFAQVGLMVFPDSTLENWE